MLQEETRKCKVLVTTTFLSTTAYIIFRDRNATSPYPSTGIRWMSDIIVEYWAADIFPWGKCLGV